MTIGIGLLCDHGQRILLAADSLISYGNVSSNAGGSKLYESQNGLYVAVADDVSWAHVIATHFLHGIDKLYPADPAYLDNVKLELKKSAEYAFTWWRSEVLKSVNLTDDEYLHDANLAPKKKAEAEFAIEEAKANGLPIQMIVAGFGVMHSVFLYTDGMKILEQASPGNFHIGSGSDAARDWLNYRRQNVHDSWEVSYYHLIEALHFAQISRAVGLCGAILLLGPGAGNVHPLWLGPDTKGGKLARKTLRKYWARKTDRGFSDEMRKAICEANDVVFKPSVLGKSKPGAVTR